MIQTLARIKINNKDFEIMVDLDAALELKNSGEGDVGSILEVDTIFHDHKKGLQASEEDLQAAFGTSDIYEAAAQIIKKGEIQLPQEYREKEREGKIKQVVDFLVTNAIDAQSGRPFTADRIESAMKEAGVNVKNKPIDAQVGEIVEQLSPIIPIKIETKKLILTIPAQHTGKAYGVINAYKESEEWLSNGDLKVVVNVPAGLQMDFYDKINAVTQGSVLSEEIKEEAEEEKKE